MYEDIKTSDDILLMDSEPIPDSTPDDIRAWYASNHDEASLASAFALVSNELWWVEDNIYDYEEGTEEYKRACDITDAWGKLMEELLADIFDILRSQNVSIPNDGWITVLAPFMERNGYEDGGGWWFPLEEADE